MNCSWNERKSLVPLYSVTETLPNCGKSVSKRRRWMFVAFHALEVSGIKPRSGFGTFALRYALATVIELTPVVARRDAPSVTVARLIRQGAPSVVRTQFLGMKLRT